MGFTMASWRAYQIMYGVMIPGASAGSNQVGASETWTPQAIWPSAAAADVVNVAASRKVSRSRSGRCERLIATSSLRDERIGRGWPLQPRGQPRAGGEPGANPVILRRWEETTGGDNARPPAPRRQLVAPTTTCPHRRRLPCARDGLAPGPRLLAPPARRYHRPGSS